MGEYIPASIRFGGKLKREHVQPLIDLVNEKHLGVDYDEPGDDGIEEADLFGTLASSQVNYGNLDEITSFCHQIGLDYEHWYDSGPEWNPSINRYLNGVLKEAVADEREEPMITLAELRKTENLASGLGTLLELAKWWAQPMPALVIVP